MCHDKTYQCPSCKGKGHVLDATVLMIPIIGWGMAAFGRNDKNSLSRDVCGQCNGKGRLHY